MPHIPKTVAPCTEPDRPVWCMIKHWACCRPEKKDEKRKVRLKKSKSNSKEVFVYFYYMSFGKKGGKIKTDAKHTNLIKTKLLWIWINNLTAEICAYVRCVLHRVGNYIWWLISSLSVEMSPTVWLIAMTFSIHLITTWWLSTECCRLHTSTQKTDSMLAFHTACALLQ